MIHYWVREVAGWCLVLLGLYIFLACLGLLLNAPDARGPGILEAPVVSVIGIIVFRGGIHLLKVAVAARICLRTQAELSKPQPADKRPKKSETPWDW